MSDVHPIHAEARALEEGLHARLQPDGSFIVRCVSQLHPPHRIEPHGERLANGEIRLRFRCSCPSGLARHDRIPCLHSAAVGRSLERRRMARWSDGDWYATAQLAHLAGESPEPDVSSLDERGGNSARWGSGRCPSCRKWVSFRCDDKTMSASEHDPACHAAWIERCERADAKLADVDVVTMLWGPER